MLRQYRFIIEMTTWWPTSVFVFTLIFSLVCSFRRKTCRFDFCVWRPQREGLKKLKHSKADNSFITSGFTNWKDETTKFAKHEQSECHSEVVLKLVTLPKQTRDIGELLWSAHENEKAINRNHFLKILSNVRIMARQVIPLRGSESDEATSGKFYSYELMALRVLREIAAEIKSLRISQSW